VTRRVRLSSLAKTDLQELWWYAFQFEQSFERAERAVLDVQSTLQVLAESPKLGRGRPWLAEGQLAFRSRTYLVVYREVVDGIEVARISNAETALRGR
jgi:toxin ParE1/3/4